MLFNSSQEFIVTVCLAVAITCLKTGQVAWSDFLVLEKFKTTGS